MCRICFRRQISIFASSDEKVIHKPNGRNAIIENRDEKHSRLEIIYERNNNKKNNKKNTHEQKRCVKLKLKLKSRVLCTFTILLECS